MQNRPSQTDGDGWILSILWMAFAPMWRTRFTLLEQNNRQHRQRMKVGIVCQDADQFAAILPRGLRRFGNVFVPVEQRMCSEAGHGISLSVFGCQTFWFEVTCRSSQRRSMNVHFLPPLLLFRQLRYTHVIFNARLEVQLEVFARI